jgi:transcriptional regulator with XRE-family HTH domain
MNVVEIGERLLRIRQEKKLSQADFAERLGVSLGAYKNYERGEREIPALILWSLFKEFDIDPLWVFEGDETDLQLTRVRPKHDLSLLVAIGLGVEKAMEDACAKFSSKKKFEIISVAYKQALIQSKIDGSLIASLVSIGGV